MKWDRSRWDFTSANVGDHVVIVRGGWGDLRERAVIEKVNKLHVIVNGRKYRKNGGCETGDGYHLGSLRKFDQSEWDEYVAKKKADSRRLYVRHFGWHNCSQEIIDAVYQLLPPEVPKP